MTLFIFYLYFLMNGGGGPKIMKPFYFHTFSQIPFINFSVNGGGGPQIMKPPSFTHVPSYLKLILNKWRK